MAPARGRRWFGLLGLFALVLVANAPLLVDFVQLLTLDTLSATSTDGATHYLRMLHTRDLYLASGHHWGWDPFWFQGYVPFLLYPHLPYVLLALVSAALPIEPYRIFNAYTLCIYLALPLVGSCLVLRSVCWSAAALAAAWLAVIMSLGAGLIGVFSIGLLSQQAGVVLFAVFVHDVLLARRLDRAAVWLGLIPLVHIHTAFAAALVWVVAGLLSWSEKGDKVEAFKEWVGGSILALLIAAPAAVALWHGWSHLGRSSSFPTFRDLFSKLLAGTLFAPMLTVLALVVAALVAIAVVPAQKRRWLATWLAVGMALVAIGVHKWNVGWRPVDRVFETMLYLRTLPYAFVLLTLAIVAVWPRFPRAARVTVALLSLGGIVQAWTMEPRLSKRIGSAGPPGGRAIQQSMADYRQVLDWVASRNAGATTTMSVSPKRPVALHLFTAVERTGLPLLVGHGAELTSVHNSRISADPDAIRCSSLQRQVHDYVIGFIVGSKAEQRARLQRCLKTPPAFVGGAWWVFETGVTWGSTPARAARFSHDPTWTELEWDLKVSAREVRMRLPLAHVAPWAADIDGKAVSIETTPDHMMQVELPRGGQRLRLRYGGYAGEWSSVLVASFALALSTLRVRRRREDDRAV